MTLHVFCNDVEHWIAETVEDAVVDWGNHYDASFEEEVGEVDQHWYQVPDEDDVAVFWRKEDWPPPQMDMPADFDYNDGIYIVTRTCKEWTETVQEGILCSEEY